MLIKSEAVEKAITQIMMDEEEEEMSSGAKKRPGRLLKKVDLLALISMLSLNNRGGVALK